MVTDTHLGVVVIGRNEGDRLKLCLTTLKNYTKNIVYVDSGSTDESVPYAKSLGINVVDLDMSIPFSAGRARNTGFDYLIAINPQMKFVQFLDGDCEIVHDWLTISCEFLLKNENYAIISGIRKEKYPDKTVYNQLCDIEWAGKIGDIEACGGDFLVRVLAYKEVGGFNPSVIAGEEPELCYRLRKAGWHIFRIDEIMTWHDVNILHFSQWWRRCIRSGHAYAQGFLLHRKDKLGYCQAHSLRIWMWALILPGFILFTSLFFHKYFIFLFGLYLINGLKVTKGCLEKFKDIKKSLLYAFFINLGRWPQLIGQIIFLKRKIFDKKFTIIEY